MAKREPCYLTKSEWTDASSPALVIKCSDPRLYEAHDEFLRSYLALKNVAPITLPGGPATILLSSPIFFSIRPQVELLQTKFRFGRVIGISHLGCAYYHLRHPNLSEEKIRQRQLDDLTEFEKEVKKIVPGAEVELYFEEPQEGHVQLYRVRI